MNASLFVLDNGIKAALITHQVLCCENFQDVHFQLESAVISDLLGRLGLVPHEFLSTFVNPQGRNRILSPSCRSAGYKIVLP